jgi:hypothetical protein
MEWAVAPLPRDLRAGAAVWEYVEGRPVERRPGSNGFICTGDRPGNAVFVVQCVSPGYARYMRRQWELEAKNVSRQEVLEVLDAELASGTLRIEPGATKTYLRAELAGDGTIPEELRWDFEIYVPGTTVQTTGIPDDTLDTLGLTLMGGGTPQSHVHVQRVVKKAAVLGGGNLVASGEVMAAASQAAATTFRMRR